MNSQIIKVYRINRDYYRFNDCRSNIQVLKVCLSILNEKKPRDSQVNLGDLSTFDLDDLKYYLYVHRHKEKESDWASYFPNDLTIPWDFNLQNLSIILFVDNEVDLYVVIGGNAFQQIVKFIDHTFGLRLLSKIIEPTEDEILSINTRGLTGARSGISEQYRDEIKVADFARFGKLPTEVHLTLSSKVTNEHFAFLKSTENDRVKIHVGKSFKVKKNLTFNEMHLLLQEIGHIMSLAEKDYLSSYIQETNSQILDENFKPLLIQAIFRDFGNRKSARSNYKRQFRFDFCNSNSVVGFYSADSYAMTEKTEKSYQKFDETNERNEIYEKVLDQAIRVLPDSATQFDFRTYIQGVRVIAYQDGKRVCSGSFLYHFTSEFSLGPQTVFLVDNRWYRIKASFIKDLRAETLSLVKRYRLGNSILHEMYVRGMKEYEYNMKYHLVDNYHVFDTLVPQGIELCDILYFDEDLGTTYLVHVKKGFDNSMRELTNQITLSARRLHTDLKTDEKLYLKKLWKSYTRKYPEDNRIDFQRFIEIFEYKIVYVLAFISHRDDDKLLEDQIEIYKSNIAKYSMIECSMDMQEYRYELNIYQIRKTTSSTDT